MKMDLGKSSVNNVNQKILLMGDIDQVFLDSAVISRFGVEYHRDMSAGIRAAAENEYKILAVIMAGVPNLELVLKQLRKANNKTRIILLARMYEEPQALKLITASENGYRIADDYLICPVQPGDLYGALLKIEERPSPAADSENTQSRIRALEILATTDELTGLKNRRYVREFCRQIIDYAKLKNGRVTVLMFDIDYFKHYNDLYSHTAGDQILIQVAVLMNRCCRPHDIIGRVGGDEFVVVFWDEPGKSSSAIDTERRSLRTEHPTEAISIAKRFQKELKKAQLQLLGPEGKGLLTISGGLASFPRDGSTAQEIFEQADKALLEAKKSGKNRICLVGGPNGDIADI